MFKAYKFILILAFGFSSIAYAEKEELSSTQIKKFKNGIFEVVSMKLVDNAIYKDEFPHDLIPFHIISYHFILYHTMLYYFILFRIISYYSVLFYIMSYYFNKSCQ